MEEQKIQALLEAADDPENCESPPSFNWEAAMLRVKAIKPVLEAITGQPFELDEHVQDASFITELSIRTPSEKPGYIANLLAVRFSTFGNLVTIWHSAPTTLPQEVIERTISALEAQGFVYVAEKYLQAPYTGKNPYLQDYTWGGRFFDYL